MKIKIQSNGISILFVQKEEVIQRLRKEGYSRNEIDRALREHYYNGHPRELFEEFFNGETDEFPLEVIIDEIELIRDDLNPEKILCLKEELEKN